MIRLVALGGTGDAYLVCALAGAVRAQYGDDVTVVLKETQVAIPAAMFGLPYDARPVEEIRSAETDATAQREYDNRLGPNRVFYAHPCFTRSGVRIDELTTFPGPLSQADMYRALLGLPLDTPLALPSLTAPGVPNRVVIIPNAVSWPNNQMNFWVDLARALEAAGWDVMFNDHEWSLETLLYRCRSAELVIGPQCGVMSILCTGQFPCRKVITTPSIDEGPGFLIGRTRLRHTYPYAYVSKFDGNDYDVDEYRVTDDNHDDVIASILTAPRTRRDPRPVTSITMPLTPGDFLDRLAVLMVKRERLGPGVVDRELVRYAEALPAEWRSLLRPLVDLHFTTFDLLEQTVPEALDSAWRDDHAAVNLNRSRVEMKRMVDDELRAPYREVKSYHAPR